LTYDDRRKTRQLQIVSGAAMLAQRSVATGDRQLIEECRIVCLSAEAGNRALWMFLKAKGLITEAQRQDWLDAGVMDLLNQIEGKASEVMVQDGKPN
jgi:hypothetical protein